MYKARHCKSSKSYKNIHKYLGKNILGNDKVNFEISKWFFIYAILFHKIRLEVSKLC